MLDQLYSNAEIEHILIQLGYTIVPKDVWEVLPPTINEPYAVPVFHVYIGDTDLTPDTIKLYMGCKHYERLRRFFNEEIVKDLVTKMIKRECSLL